MERKFTSSSVRIFLSRIIFCILVGYLLFYPPPTFISPILLDFLELIGFAFLIVAALGRIWCLIYSGGKKNKTLVTEGPYSIVRNPLYVFSFIGAIGLGLAAENPFLSVVLVLLFVIYYPFVVRKEEQHLISIFDEEYRNYAARTPRWIPNFRLFHEPQELIINPRYIRRGILSAMWFLWFFFLWELVEFIRTYLHTKNN